MSIAEVGGKYEAGERISHITWPKDSQDCHAKDSGASKKGLHQIAEVTPPTSHTVDGSEIR